MQLKALTRWPLEVNARQTLDCSRFSLTHVHIAHYTEPGPRAQLSVVPAVCRCQPLWRSQRRPLHGVLPRSQHATVSRTVTAGRTVPLLLRFVVLFSLFCSSSPSVFSASLCRWCFCSPLPLTSFSFLLSSPPNSPPFSLPPSSPLLSPFLSSHLPPLLLPVPTLSLFLSLTSPLPLPLSPCHSV